MFPKTDRSSFALALRRTFLFAFCLMTCLSFFKPTISYARTGQWWSNFTTEGAIDLYRTANNTTYQAGNHPMGLQGEKEFGPVAGYINSCPFEDGSLPDSVGPNESSEISVAFHDIAGAMSQTQAPANVTIKIWWADENGDPAPNPPSSVSFDITSSVINSYSLSGSSNPNATFPTTTPYIASSYSDYLANSANHFICSYLDNGFNDSVVSATPYANERTLTKSGTHSFNLPLVLDNDTGLYTATKVVHFQDNSKVNAPSSTTGDTFHHNTQNKVEIQISS